jgi:predicted CoA-binding protein
MKKSEAIEAFLAQPALAVVGVSRSPRKFGTSACRALKEKGYRVYPIHRSAAQIDGMTCYLRLADLPERVGGVLVVVRPWDAIEVIYDAAANGIRRVWLQQGAESLQALQICDQLGLDVVSGECILMFAQPKGIHKVHQFVRRVLGTLPA